MLDELIHNDHSLRALLTVVMVTWLAQPDNPV